MSQAYVFEYQNATKPVVSVIYFVIPVSSSIEIYCVPVCTSLRPLQNCKPK